MAYFYTSEQRRKWHILIYCHSTNSRLQPPWEWNHVCLIQLCRNMMVIMLLQRWKWINYTWNFQVTFKREDDSQSRYWWTYRNVFGRTGWEGETLSKMTFIKAKFCALLLEVVWNWWRIVWTRGAKWCQCKNNVLNNGEFSIVCWRIWILPWSIVSQILQFIYF